MCICVESYQYGTPFVMTASSPFASFLKSSIPNSVNLKKELLQKCIGTSNGVKASPETRDEIASIVRRLEKVNAVKKISSSKKMDGNWKLLYTTNDGSSAGKLGPFVGRVDQEIDVSTKRYKNFVRLGLLTGVLTATWDNLGDKLWRVKFLDIEFKAFGISLTKKPLNALGTWRMSYLDDTLRILYAAGSSGKENIYVLIREAF